MMTRADLIRVFEETQKQCTGDPVLAPAVLHSMHAAGLYDAEYYPVWSGPAQEGQTPARGRIRVEPLTTVDAAEQCTAGMRGMLRKKSPF